MEAWKSGQVKKRFRGWQECAGDVVCNYDFKEEICDSAIR